MNLITISTIVMSALSQDIADGTLHVSRDAKKVTIDGTNWLLTIHNDGISCFTLPTDDPHYYDEDLDAFIENVLATETEESLSLINDWLDGYVVDGLKKAGNAESLKLSERL